MGREKIVVGELGEKLALKFLQSKGYRVLETNMRTPFGEIDVVAKKGDIIIFIEIKTRSTSSLGPPYLAVTKAKQIRLIKNALFYLKRRGLLDSDWRIDVVSVKLDYSYNLEYIELIENAVEEY